MKEVGKKRELKESKKFFNNIFLSDIDKQAKEVEFFGLIGIIIFFIILALSWIVKLDITIPVSGKVKNINERIVIFADISKKYIPVVEEGQKVKIYIEELEHKRKILLWGKLSQLFEVNTESDIKGEVIIDLENIKIDTHLIRKNQEVKMRIVTSQQRILDFLISKKK